MFRISAENYDEVIRLHVLGYSMGKIAKIIGGISKTTVHNIIRDWVRRTSAGNIEDVRFFMRTLRESGITIEKCIEGLRIQQMLKEFGIPEEPYDWISDRDMNIGSGSTDIGTGNQSLYNSSESKSVTREESILDIINNSQKGCKTNEKKKKNVNVNKNSRLGVNPVSYFVQVFYNECKTHKLAPAFAVKWVRDMLDFFSVTTYTSYPTSNEQPFVNTPEYVNDGSEGNVDGIHNNHVDSVPPYAGHTTFPNVQKGQSANVIDLPLISMVPLFIVQNKEKINRLLWVEKKIIDRIQKANEQKIKTESEVDILIKRHEEIFRYYRWYKNLGQELSAKYNIKLENAIESFCRAINDFKRYDYDPYQIISEYKNIESLHQVRESILQEIDLKTPIRDYLSRQVSELTNQLSFCTQTIRIYNELCIYGFGLKQLKILLQTLAEISTANNIRPEEVGRKFLKDIEDQYDDKVGFENKIAELKIEKTKIEEEIPNYKSTLILQRWAIPSLLHLYNNGVTDQDIILVSDLVQDFKKNDYLSSFLSNQNKDYNNIIIKVAMSKLNPGYNNNNNSQNKNNNNKQNKLDDWKSFIQKLKELKNLDYLLKSRNLYVNNLEEQIKELTIKKQNIESNYIELVNSFMQIYSTFSDTVKWYDYINKRINSKIMTSSRFTPVIIYLNTTNYKNKKEEEEEDKSDS